MSGLHDTIVAALRHEGPPAPASVQSLVCEGDFDAAAGIVGALVLQYLAPIVLSGEVHPDSERCSDPDLCHLFIEAGIKRAEAVAGVDAALLAEALDNLTRIDVEDDRGDVRVARDYRELAGRALAAEYERLRIYGGDPRGRVE